MSDVLKDKSYKNFEYTSRYNGVPYYYHTLDNKYFFGLGSNLYKSTTYVAHQVKESDTLDSLSLTYYGNPTYYWVIAYFNDIQDAFEPLHERFQIIKIPSLTAISFGKERK